MSNQGGATGWQNCQLVQVRVAITDMTGANCDHQIITQRHPKLPPSARILRARTQGAFSSHLCRGPPMSICQVQLTLEIWLARQARGASPSRGLASSYKGLGVLGGDDIRSRRLRPGLGDKLAKNINTRKNKHVANFRL